MSNVEREFFVLYLGNIEKLCEEGNFASAFYQYETYRRLNKNANIGARRLKDVMKIHLNKLSDNEKNKLQ